MCSTVHTTLLYVFIIGGLAACSTSTVLKFLNSKCIVFIVLYCIVCIVFSFVNWTRLPRLCEKLKAILLVLVGLTAGRQSDEILVDLKIFKNLYQSHY